jgi:hypothetical protein
MYSVDSGGYTEDAVGLAGDLTHFEGVAACEYLKMKDQGFL